MKTYKPMDSYTLAYQKIKDALALLLFIVRKRNRDIKARKVDVGNKQRTYDGYDKSNGSFPTVNTDSAFLVGVIDAHERRAVAMSDINNYFLHTKNYYYVLRLLLGNLTELLVKVDPKFYQNMLSHQSKECPFSMSN